MKLKIEADKLIAAVGKISAIPTQSHIAALDHILIKTENNRVSITATDLDTWGVFSFGHDSAASGSAIVPSGLFMSFIKSQSGSFLDIEKVGEKLIVKGSAKINLPTLSLEEFPAIPDSTGNQVSVDIQPILGAIRKSRYAAASDIARPNLNGIYFGHGFAAATDGHRAVIADGNFGISDVIIPAKLSMMLIKLFEKKTLLNIAMGDGRICFNDDDLMIGGRLIEGSYPDVRSVIPNFDETIVANKFTLEQAVKVCALCQPIGEKITIDLSISPFNMVATGAIAETEHPLSLIVSQKGHHQIKLNYKYLLDALNAVSLDEISISSQSPVMPIVLKDGETRHVIMPMR